ncbi:hypothetical protein HWV62_9041 [Athelia sp. TMB]|nr:hypothetical protein HWV62_9041 [Athelia sp. TMB]
MSAAAPSDHQDTHGELAMKIDQAKAGHSKVKSLGDDSTPTGVYMNTHWLNLDLCGSTQETKRSCHLEIYSVDSWSKLMKIGTITTGLGVGAYEVFQGRRAGPLAGASALNGGLVAATFFSVREYGVSPLLSTNFARPRQETSQVDGHTTPTSWADMRKHHVLDSAVSGALTGGMFNTWQRGRAGTIPGLCTGALVCAFLQWGVNELDIARVKYVSKNPYRPQVSSSPSAAEQKGITERVFTAVGFTKISDEEHLAKLRVTRDAALKQIAKLEVEEAAKAAQADREGAH